MLFAEILRAERSALVAFVRFLEVEQEALIQSDAERLAALAPEKAASVELLTSLGEQRKHALQAHHLNADPDGMRTFLDRDLGDSGEAPRIWREILSHAGVARQLNSINGMLIEGGLQRNRMKLAVLHSAAATSGVYRADGQFGPLRGTRSLSQA